MVGERTLKMPVSACRYPAVSPPAKHNVHSVRMIHNELYMEYLENIDCSPVKCGLALLNSLVWSSFIPLEESIL